MATSRTGTAKYLRNRARIIRQARASGVTHCPGHEGNGFRCGRVLDYTQPLLPESVEADHIVPHHRGGTDDLDNLRVLCRACNLDRNRKGAPMPTVIDFPTTSDWTT